MSGPFDPYYHWLGIPPREQPPDHYRLLGLVAYEAHADVIENAADRQMAHLRQHQSGKHGDASQKLLNEVAGAKLCLLSPEEKAAYDAQLRRRETAPDQERPLKPPRPPKPAARPAPANAADSSAAIPAPRVRPALIVKSAPPVKPAPRRDPAHQHASFGGVAALVVAVVGGGLLLLVLFVGAGAYLLLGGSSDSTATVEAPTIDRPPQPPRQVRTPSRQSTNNIAPNNPPRNRFPGPSGPPPTILNPGGPPTLPETTEPLRPTAARGRQPPAENDPPPIAAPPPVDFFPPKEEDARLPIPTEADRAARRGQIGELFPRENARTFDDKVALSGEMLKTGRETRSDRAAQFELLTQAVEVAAEAGGAKPALAAVAELEKLFQVDGPALRIEAVKTAADATVPVSARDDLLSEGEKLVDSLFAEDRYLVAAELIGPLQAAALRYRAREQMQQLAEKKRIGADLLSAYRAARPAIEKLKQDPTDKAAATAAGKYFVLAKGDWQLGLPMLAAGEDELLSAVARQEMAVPTDKQERKALADAWRKLAEQSSGVAAQHEFARAALWYRRVENQFNGLAKAEVQKHLETIGRPAVDGGQPFQPPRRVPAAPRTPAYPLDKPIDLLAKINTTRDAVNGVWGFLSEGTLVARPGNLTRLQVPFTPPETYTLDLEATRTSGRADLTIGLIYRGTPCHVAIDAWDGTACGVTASRRGVNVAAGKHYARYLANGQPSKIHCIVQREGFLVQCDGREILRYVGPPRWDAMNTAWKVPDQTQLALGANKSNYHLRSMRLTPVAPAPLPRKLDAPPPPLGQPIDLLAQVDPVKHAVHGTWQKRDGELISPRTQFARLQIPVHPPEEYDLEVEVTRQSGKHDLCLGLVYQGRQCHIGLDRFASAITHLLVDAKSRPSGQAIAEYRGRGPALPMQERAKIKCEVRRDAVRLLVDGEPLLAYRGAADWEGMNEKWQIPDKQALMLGVWSTCFQVHSMKLTPVIGNGAAASPSQNSAAPKSKEIDLLQLIDLDKHVVAGNWELRNGVLLTSRDPHGRVAIPYAPPESYRIEMDVSQRLGLGPIVIGLVRQGRQFAVEVGKSEGRIHALDGKSTTDKRGAFIALGKPTKIVCEVTPKWVSVTCNDQIVVEYRGDASRLSLPDQWQVPDGKSLFIGSSKCLYHVSAMKLTPLGEAAGPVELLSLIDPLRDFTAGNWRLEKNGQDAALTLSSPPGGSAEMRIPFIPAGEYDLEVQMAVNRREVDAQIKLPDFGPEFTCNLENTSSLQAGRARKLRCEVRRNGVKLFLDGKLAGQQRRNVEDRKFRPNMTPFRILTKDTPVAITAFRITEIGPRGKAAR